MDNDKPRQTYYAFAHQALPEVFFSDPALLLRTLKDNGVAFLGYIWKKLEMYAHETGQGIEQQLEVTLTQLAGADLALVTLPQPEKRTEAYFVAMLDGAEGRKARYLVLELGFDTEERPITVLGEWTDDGVHHNHGNGPHAQADLFVEAVGELVAANQV